ncbi:hypothetical protein GTY75_24740 [Streptomyces sp. SID8381]|uniref:hypothetical protein n=1 Tax=unclassified Streptomyces TaxID=2593676 RepID=UPI00131A4038|nr:MULTISPECIES: hypothetical protein [unclassified Streptomyces]MYX29800.1 hypothetical protein [Streptomyces sp. SID8381]
MKRNTQRTVVSLSVAAVILTGCSDTDGGAPAPSSATSAVPSRQTVPARSSKALVAEEVKNVVEERISADEERFGSGVNSPCATASPELFTAKCQAAADATSSAADLALSRIDGRAGFATLTLSARRLQAAVRQYDRLGCAGGPAATDTRHACLAPAAVIAQGLDDLRDGADLALAGK